MIKQKRGCYCIESKEIDMIVKKYQSKVPSAAIRYQEERDGKDHHHLTIITPQEMNILKTTDHHTTLLSILSTSSSSTDYPLFDIGMSYLMKNTLEGWYIVIYSPALQSLRYQLGLPEKEFHITIGFYKQDMMSTMMLSSLNMMENSDENDNDAVTTVSFVLPQYITSWNNISSLMKIITYLLNTNHMISKTLYPKIFQETRLILEHIVYTLLDDSPVNTEDRQEEECILKPTQRIEFLKEVGRYCVSYKESFIVFIEDIGWYLFQKGLLIGLKFLLCSFLYKHPISPSTNRTLDISPIVSFFPMDYTFLGHYTIRKSENLSTYYRI